MTPAAIPFRWDVSRREQLGRLAHGPAAEQYPGFADDLRACCTRLVSLGGEAQLVFVGRSPESIFDYLSGLLADTSWSDRLVLVNLSLYNYTPADIARLSPGERAAVRQQFAHLGLAPGQVAAGRPVALMDVVSGGGTLGTLQALLVDWAREDGVDPAAVRRRLRFVGITPRRKNSPNTWRWQQQVEWAAAYRPSALRSVSVPWRLWTYIADGQKKVSRRNPPLAWGREEMARPPREPQHLEALRLALELYEQGRDGAERERFAAQLAAQPEMRHPWLRRLVLELRGG